MKLIDIFDTKYFVAHMKVDLEYFLQSLKQYFETGSVIVSDSNPKIKEVIDSLQGHITIDLAGARFIPGTAELINKYASNTIMFCDTENLIRDEILQENRNRMAMEFRSLSAPKLESVNDLAKYIKDLRDDVVYTCDSNQEIMIPLFTLISLYRPEVQLDLASNYEALFKYIGSYLYLEEREYDSYLYAIGSTFYVTKFRGDTTYMLGEGEMSYEDFHENYTHIPAVFGKEKLNKDKRWERIKLRAIEDIKESLSEKKQTVRDIWR